MTLRSNLMLALLLLPGCRDSAYSAAARVDTLAAYQQFITAHPQDDDVETAKARMAELEFTEAQKVHTVVAYKRYLEQYPDATKATAAQALLEAMRFNSTQTRNTASAWRQFLKDHPEGAHHEQAEKELEQAELREVTALDDSAELKRMAGAYGEDERGTRATVRLDEQSFAAAKTASALTSYLRDFPAGAHRDEARVALLSRQLEGLLVSGRLAEARVVAQKAPLSKQVPKLEERFKRAAELEALSTSKDAAVQRALPGYYLRSFDDLVKSLQAPDPMDRWQAAEELGELVDVKAIDPLVEALRAARQPLVRQRAFASLGRLLRALPPEVAEYEVATRVDLARLNASDAQVVLTIAVLLDLSGQLDKAAAEYGRAFDAQAPDPVVLSRWVQIRKEHQQPFSAAVAARQLSLWAEELVKSEQPSEPGTGVLGTARALCAAAESARVAAVAIGEARREKTEFPEDLRQFDVRAAETLKLAEAKLRDAELKLLEQDARARRCGDDAVRLRLADAEKQRVEALGQVTAKAPKAAGLVLALAQQRDPSAAVRVAAAAVPRKP